jgi:tricorn protease
VAKTGANGGFNTVLRLELNSGEPETLFEGPIGQVFEANETSTIVKTRDKKLLQIIAKPKQEAKDIQTAKLVARIDRQAEYLQMFDDSWRYQRDFYYDPGLHGVDWEARREHYRPQAAAAHSDQELTAIIRELHGELAAGHVYVSTEPPYNRRDARDVGMLGINFAIKDNAYVISKILKPGARQFQHRSALDNPALDVSEGDYLLAVNGMELNTSNSPWEPFAGLADQYVELTIADSASGKNKRTLRVKTLASERKLRELVWAEDNRKFVDNASENQVGYIYVPNTGTEGLNELMQAYRAQYHKKALIIDERFNRGGALGDRFVELLNRPPLAYFSSRNGADYPLPEYSHRGAKAMLINSWSYSGGDGFPFLFKTAAVGPLIGTRTWGGLIGPGMRMSLINGGFISAPPQRVYDIKGQWAEGNEGVEPNIPVLNNPGELARGHDQQLERALKLLLDEIDQMPPVRVPDFPAKSPDRSTLE